VYEGDPVFFSFFFFFLFFALRPAVEAGEGRETSLDAGHREIRIDGTK
jgi:hypothetical protein